MGEADKGRILVVEGDKFMRIIIEKLCSPIYNVTTKENGKKALEYLEEVDESDLPWVIISNQVMPNMKGTDFLRQSQKFSPDSIKILLTAEEQTKDIVMAMQEANAFLFQPKPFQNLPLLQSVKVAVDKYKSRKSIRSLNHTINNLKTQNDQYVLKLKQFKSHIDQLKKESDSGSKKSDGLDIGYFKFLSFLSTNSERWYYTPHTKEVTALASHLARQMELSKTQIQTVTLAAMIHGSYLSIMPPRLQVMQPFLHTDEELQNEFISYYYSTFEQITSIEGINEIGKIACMVFEKYDGTGFPQGLGGMNYPVEGQILQIANLYHDLVYKIRKRDALKLKREGKIEQTYKETLTRHNEAIAFLFKHVKWFDQDLLNMFKDCARRGTSRHLQPVKETLTLEFSGKDYLVVGKVQTSKEKYEEEQQKNSTKDITEIDAEGNSRNRKVEIKMIDDLEENMEVNSDIKTDRGSVVFEKGTKLTKEKIDKLKKFEQQGSIAGFVTVVKDDEDALDMDDDNDDLWGSRDIILDD